MKGGDGQPSTDMGDRVKTLKDSDLAVMEVKIHMFLVQWDKFRHACYFPAKAKINQIGNLLYLFTHHRPYLKA